MSKSLLDALLDAPVHEGLAFSTDGQALLTSCTAGGNLEATVLPLEGGAPEVRVPADEGAVRVVGAGPEPGSLLFTRDRGGDEVAHLFFARADGSVEELTPWEGVRIEVHGWLRDRSRLLIGANRRDRCKMDILAWDPTTGEFEEWCRNDSGRLLEAWSGCGRWLAFAHLRTVRDVDMELLDRRSGEVRWIAEHQGEAHFGAQAFSADDSELVLVSDEGRDRKVALRVPVEGGERELWLERDGDILQLEFSRGGRARALVHDRDASSHLEVEVEGGALEVSGLPRGDVHQLRFSEDERLLALLLETPHTPSAPWVIDLDSGEARAVPGRGAALEPGRLSAPEHVTFPAEDGLEVPGVYYPAREPNGAGVVWVHGGPGGQSRLQFRPLLQFLAAQGYPVLAVNNRGSSGYGKRFFGLDRRGHGREDLKDCVAARGFLVERVGVDPARVAITGGSYGGFLTLAALAFRPGVFAVGVDIYGISNWVRTQRDLPPWWMAFKEALWEEVGHPVEDEEYLRSISPLFHADRIDVPLMVLQGASDPRVLQAESDEIVAAVSARGVPVEYLLFEGEGHGFERRETRQRAWTGIAGFLARHL